ncbi:MAG: MarR family winged helix-turn-helix transcriptional regulator [Pseudomonadota bacterium]
MTLAAEEMLEGIRAILRAFTVDETRFPPAEGRIKYNPVDFQTLYFLCDHPGSKNTELARFLGVAATSAQSVCDRLIKRGFVERNSSDTNLRAVALSLTAEGRSIVAAIRRQDIANCERMLKALPVAERRVFAAQVATIASSLGE